MGKSSTEIMVEFTKDYVKQSARTFLIYGSILGGLLLITSVGSKKPKTEEKE